ncbi:trypsin-like peptidase domain-containing protein [Actinomyces sp. B33]|uniref:S1C family serine protease n=1 Tax=Actinomyces sp. B33 TaxID=2942131 RepID=UPI0023426718|nr:trypsin-like peptidase domain-containing protein [Actinomyces sp. B33]MDC4233539.1 trypsin-like peptidase domain-containing protein [Actinomyces sp. B33]
MSDERNDEATAQHVPAGEDRSTAGAWTGTPRVAPAPEPADAPQAAPQAPGPGPATSPFLPPAATPIGAQPRTGDPLMSSRAPGAPEPADAPPAAAPSGPSARGPQTTPPGPTGAPQQTPPRSAWAAPTSSPLAVGPIPPSPLAPAPPSPGPRARKGPGWAAFTAGMLATALVSVGASWAILNGGRAPAGTDRSAATIAQTVPPVASNGEGVDWQTVAATVSPAVVTINASGSSASGIGSGAVYDAEGHIVTNYHVISPALGGGAVSVTLADGRIYDAEIVGHDQATDLAVIRLINPPSDLAVASFGSSADLAVGEQVMAIGAPLGLSNTATTGIISALNRPVEVSTQSQSEADPNDPFGQLPFNQRGRATADSVVTNAIQVDASINPGNSGGPLFDATGAVIGINSSIASMRSSESSEAGSIGLGFAIPSDLVVSVTDQLIASGSVSHAVLGVSITTGQVEIDGDTKAGALVTELVPDGAASAGGIEAGDTIIAVDGQEVSSGKQLTGYIRRYRSGDEATIAYVRDGVEREATVTLRAKE